MHCFASNACCHCGVCACRDTKIKESVRYLLTAMTAVNPKEEINLNLFLLTAAPLKEMAP